MSFKSLISNNANNSQQQSTAPSMGKCLLFEGEPNFSQPMSMLYEILRCMKNENVHLMECSLSFCAPGVCQLNLLSYLSNLYSPLSGAEI